MNLTQNWRKDSFTNWKHVKTKMEIIFKNGEEWATGIDARTQHPGDLEKGVCSQISKFADNNAGLLVKLFMERPHKSEYVGTWALVQKKMK